MSTLVRGIIATLAMLATTSHAFAAERADQAVAVSQGALGQRMPEIQLTDTAGRKTRMSEFLGKPLLVSLIYTSCADVCPTLIESLYPAVKAAQAALGVDSFAVITVGFDTRNDTPSRMRSFARSHGVDLPNWTFVAADEESLDQLARAVGFAFYSRAAGFDHLSQVSLVGADGVLQSQIYGAVFEPPLIVEPLKALVFQRAAPLSSVTRLVDRVKFFCTVYDPTSGRYYFNYSLFLTIGIGIGCFGLVLMLLVKEWRRPA